MCPNRVYVQSGVYEKFVDMLARRVAALKVAPATDPDAQIGPMINARAIDKIARHVDDAVAQGRARARRRQAPDRARAELLRADRARRCDASAMHLSCEETFGPVVPLFRFDDEAEAIRAANDTPFGLAVVFLQPGRARASTACRAALEAGIVGINEGALASEAAPFGGVKESGYGREGSKYGLDDYLSIKYLCQGGSRMSTRSLSDRSHVSRHLRARAQRLGHCRTCIRSTPASPARM